MVYIARGKKGEYEHEWDVDVECFRILISFIVIVTDFEPCQLFSF